MHEAGHWIFWLLGEYMHVLGGSLNQVLIPTLFFVYFLTKRELYASSIILFWVGENFLSIAYYAHDAIIMQLPLLGGDASIHDWNWLLVNSGLLHHTYLIAGAIKVTGVVIITLAAACGIYSALYQNPTLIDNTL